MDYTLILRLALGLPFVYFVAGFPLTRLFLANEKTFSLKLLLTSFAFSLFLTYPAAVLTTIIEGQSAAAIYSVHLPTSLFSLILVSFVTFLFLIKKNPRWHNLTLPKFTTIHFLLILVILIYSLFVFWNLGRADAVGDDYDLGYQAYNLHDGIQAARKGYLLSFSTHPPLMMTIKHFGMQLFSPWGVETLSDWMFRGVEGIIGLATILAVYLLVSRHFSPRVAIISSFLFATNNYLIFFGRYFEREIYYLPFLVLAVFFSLEYRKNRFLRDLILSGFFVGCGLLVKTSALIILPVIIYSIFNRSKFVKPVITALLVIFLVYLPVIIFNILMYFNTGYLDGTFSRIFQTYHPLLTKVPANSPIVNPGTIFLLLADLYSWPVFFLFLFSTGHSLLFSRASRLVICFSLWLGSSLFFFMFSPMRAYYLIVFTIPLVFFAANLVDILIKKNKLFTLIFIALTIFSSRYAFTSNLVSHRLGFEYADMGNGGDLELLKRNFWQTDYSFVSAAFSPEMGWKKLAPKLESIYRDTDCLELADESLDLPVRRYLGTHDLVKRALLGKNYPHKFLMCDESVASNRIITIGYNNFGKIDLEVKSRY